MTELDEQEQALRIELLTVQIDKARLDIERVRQEIHWGPYKAIATISVAAVAFAGIILGVAHIIH